jgi:hypothetical protein
MRGFSVHIHPFATEHGEPDEDGLDREPRKLGGNDINHDELNLRIKLCESELNYLRALKNGNEKLAAEHRKQAQACDLALSRLLRGHHDEGGEGEDDDDGD